MQSCIRRCGAAAAAAVLAFSLTGCFPTREGVYSDIRADRLESYARWRSTDKEELLPRASGDLTIQDAVRLALVYNPVLERMLQEQVKARGQLYTAYAEGLPTIEAVADYTRLDEVQTVNVGGGVSFPVGSRNNYSYGVDITQPIFKGASIPAAIRGAKFFQFLNDEKVRLAVQELILRTVRQYYDVVLAQHLYHVQEEALQFAEANLRDVAAKEEAGVAIPFDVLRARVEVSNVEADMIQQRNQLNRARTALLRTLGVSQKSEVTFPDELTYVPMEPDLERAVESAFVHRPELYQSELDVRFQREALLVFYSDYLPRLEGFGTQRWAKPDPHNQSNLNWGRQWQAGLRLRWTLFDGLRREGRIIQQKATLQQSIITLSDAEQLVLEEVANAILDLTDADELVKSQQLNLQRANEALRLVTIGAQEGVNTELEVLDARSALTRARGLYYTGLYSHAVARLTLQRAMGLLTTPPGTATVPEEGPRPGEIKEFETGAAEQAAGEHPAEQSQPVGQPAAGPGVLTVTPAETPAGQPPQDLK